MARFKPYDYKQLVMVPVRLEEQLVPGTLEDAIHHLIEERIDTSYFDERFCNDETGRTAYDPKVLLKIVLFGYSRGMMSSRPLERACVENVVFMALACGQKPDDSNTAAFVSTMGNEIARLYTQVLLVCEEEELLGGTHFSMDGLKLSSTASKEWSGKLDDLQIKKENLQRKVKEAIREHREADKREGKNLMNLVVVVANNYNFRRRICERSHDHMDKVRALINRLEIELTAPRKLPLFSKEG